MRSATMIARRAITASKEIVRLGDIWNPIIRASTLNRRTCPATLRAGSTLSTHALPSNTGARPLHSVPLHLSRAHPFGEKFAAAGDAEVAVKGFDVVVNRVAAEEHDLGDFLFTVASQKVLEGLALARGEGRDDVGGGIAVGLVDPAQLDVGQFRSE